MPKVAQTPGMLTETITVAVNPAFIRLFTELAKQTTHLSRSRVIREAVIEKADRELAPNWREELGFDVEESAA